MSFNALYTGYSGLRAAQAALTTVSHNIANANTEGYTRQRADLQTLRPFESTVGTLGAGVDVVDVSRRRDAFMDARVRSEIGRLGTTEQQADLLGRLESLFGDLQGGLNADLADVFAAFEDVAVHPENPASREVARSSLENLTNRFNSLAEQASRLEQDAGEDLEAEVRAINVLIDGVAALNDEIVTGGATGNTPNDLMDTRDGLLDQLSEKAGVTIRTQADGSVRVLLDGLALVDGQATYKLGTDGTDVTHPHGGPAVGGVLRGTQLFIERDIVGVRASLDEFATQLRDAINGVNASGYVAPGVPGPPLLDGTDAASLRVQIATGSEIAAASSDPPATFDGRNAQRLADLRDVNLPSGSTPSEAFARIVSRLGATTRSAFEDASRQAGLATSAQLSRESAHGVSIDEEMASLVQYQRSLEAASRVMSSADEAMSTIINRMGRVGL